MHYIKIMALLIFLSAVQMTMAQVSVVKLNKRSIPASIKYKGDIVNAVRFTDNEGEHLLITTETGITDPRGDSEDGNGRDAALYAYQYTVKSTGSLQLNWQMVDFVKDCQVDLEAIYIPGSFAVTDLDRNGKAEVWLMYKTLCAGDISPGEMKIIMHEGGNKYAIRGQNKVKVGPGDYDGGKYTFDEAFKTGPELFRKYAQELWRRNIWGPRVD
ncbi:M949_RS01915 family surface polysaccharide biosynthesis protein [Mucilaginibacter sp. SG564]|uniref:M949_RS01915 family surface polysaccharide biosynthesis protein n=1 Tax=Mucilaginibacter sp. SG564 TaxID=2587022 RepID=UPI001C12AFBD|nr:hypothetical protein [Mucilaginibacter sp. SG564]NOW98435.1 hypothetical protein [Mucilaginibacter sp. SG564]